MLRLGEATADAEHFRRLSAEGRAAAACGPGRAAAVLDRALSVWRGPALAHCRGGPICAAQADRPKEQRLLVLVLVAFCQARPRSARSEGSTAAWERLAQEHPLRERFFDRWMAAPHRADRWCEAFAVYERVRRRLAAEPPRARTVPARPPRGPGARCPQPPGPRGAGRCPDRADGLPYDDAAPPAAGRARIGRRRGSSPAKCTT